MTAATTLTSRDTRRAYEQPTTMTSITTEPRAARPLVELGWAGEAVACKQGKEVMG